LVIAGCAEVERKVEPEIGNSVLSGSGRNDGVAMPDPTPAAPPMLQREALFARKLARGVLFSFCSSTSLHDVLPARTFCLLVLRTFCLLVLK
jgi:hypothetical protein